VHRCLVTYTQPLVPFIQVSLLLQASQGSAVISGETLTNFLSTKGYYVPEHWDVYWANRQVQHNAAILTSDGQALIPHSISPAVS